jgi:voltage-gated potassium channel
VSSRRTKRPTNRLHRSVAAVVSVLVVGTFGYWILGFGVLDAAYQTVTTVTTVGFREVEPLSGAGQVFTMVLILAGVGAVLSTFGITFEFLVEGQLRQARRRRRMDDKIGKLRGHVVVCGWGRVGKAIAGHLEEAGETVVIVDQDQSRLEDLRQLTVVGDATSDSVLLEAGVDRAKTLIAAIDTDAENLYVTLSGRSLAPDLFIIARARDEASEAKLIRAGADRVVNPQAIGGARMAAFVSQPHVAEFLDVVMHDHEFEFQLEEMTVGIGSPLVGTVPHDPTVRERTGALILCLRSAEGAFITSRSPDALITPGQILIAIGTQSELALLAELNRGNEGGSSSGPQPTARS